MLAVLRVASDHFRGLGSRCRHGGFKKGPRGGHGQRARWRQPARIDANCFSCGTIGRTFATFMLAFHSAILQPVAFPHRRVEVVLLHAANNERHAPLTPLR